jgi:hypothetical protein
LPGKQAISLRLAQLYYHDLPFVEFWFPVPDVFGGVVGPYVNVH